MPTEKVSLTLEQELVAQAREQAGERGLSSYMNRALRHQLQRDRLTAYLAEFVKEHGPFDPEMVEEVRKEWPAQAINPPQRRSA